MNIADIKPPLSQRAATHGRNVMIVSCLALALGLVPGINLEDLTLFGLKFENEPRAQTSAWVLIAIVLVYYCWRFYMDFTTDFAGWSAMTSVKSRKTRFVNNNYANVGERNKVKEIDLFVTRLDREFWRYDVALPFSLAVAAIITIGFKLFDILGLLQS